MPDEETENTFIASIIGPEQMPVGMGILIDPDTIITCAHVVNKALGRDSYDPEMPKKDPGVKISFLSGDDRKSWVQRWLLPNDDLCVLRLMAPAPADLELAEFFDCYPGIEFRACRRSGSRLEWGYGKTGPLSGGGYCQVEAIPGRPFLKPGYSGSPAIDATSGDVLGIVALLNRDAQITGHIISGQHIRNLGLIETEEPPKQPPSLGHPFWMLTLTMLVPALILMSAVFLRQSHVSFWVMPGLAASLTLAVLLDQLWRCSLVAWKEHANVESIGPQHSRGLAIVGVLFTILSVTTSSFVLKLVSY